MWDAVLLGLANNLQFSHLFVVFIGAVAGIAIGAMPGLSAVSAVALLLPFTFAMEPAQGVIMLASVYMAAGYGGSISAILLNIPGTSGAACTILDGTPMTRKGLAQEALYISLLASAVGGLIGATVLLTMTGTLARVSLMLGPSETFMVAVAGLSLVAGLSGKNIVKGLIGVMAGIALTLVGQDIVTGEMRYTFGDYRLVGGISLVPALLGLFTVATIFQLLEQPNQPVAPLLIRKGILGHVMSRLLRMKIVLAWSSVLGTLVGIVPGAGSSISAFLAYGEARRISKNRDEFGKGAWEGVAAPEAANNAVRSGSLVPLLALGIPGSASAAVMFGALGVHGVIPGPRLFVERAELAYTFMIGLFFTVAAMLAIGLATIRWSSLIVKAPRTMMIPGILMLACMGAYGLSNSVFDVYILVTVGLFAYFLAKLEVPMVTIALGLVLGRLMEESFQQTLLLAQIRTDSLVLYVLSRPITIFLMLVASAVIVTGILQIRQAAQPSPEAPDTQSPAYRGADGAGRGMSMRRANGILAGTGLAVAAFGLLQTMAMSASAARFPLVVFGGLAALSLVLFVASMRASPRADMRNTFPFDGVPWLNILTVMVALAIFTATVRQVGFYEGALAFGAAIHFFLLSRGDRRSVWANAARAAVFAVLLATGLYVAFSIVLGVPTPRGLLL